MARIIGALRVAYPDAHCALVHRSPYELLAATILSAQCTDVRVNLVTPALFTRFPGPAALATGTLEEIEALIRTTGFFRNKAKSLQGMAQAILARFGGEVPMTLAELVTLPGVGRKTANVLLGEFGTSEGVVVDTHVGRLSKRLGLTTSDDPVKIERDLMPLVPPTGRAELAHLLIWHGRAVCVARKPKCAVCPIAADCATGSSLRTGST